jgi:predicted permease
LRGVLVAVEVALSLTMLVGAGLLVRSLLHVMSTDRGFQTEERLLATVSIPDSYADARRTEIVETILARAEALPQVVSVAAVSGRPLMAGSTGLGIVAADAPSSDAAPWASWRIVTKDYFKVMGLPLLAGRGFTEQDIIEKPWRLIISKRLADELWPGKNPVGQTAILWKGQGNLPGEVIGVVGNMRERGLEQRPTLAVYFPAYGAMSATTLNVVMHTRGAPEAVVPVFQSLVRSIDASLPVSEVRTLEEVVSRSVATRRFTMLLLAVFAVLALILSAAGVYGVLAYTIARRTAEIGVRLALGASPGRVLRRVFSAGMYPVAAGLVLGGAASFWLSRFMASLLFEIQPNDPATYGLVIAALTVVAALACYIPARRVLRVDPAIALRSE